MRTSYTLDTFSPEAWDSIFGAFVTANKSHWRGAPYDAVVNILRMGRRFEFAVKGMDTWTCKLVLHLLPDGHLDASFVQNDQLSGLMRRQLARMQQVFEQEIGKLR